MYFHHIKRLIIMETKNPIAEKRHLLVEGVEEGDIFLAASTEKQRS